MTETLEELLNKHTKEGELYEKLEDKKARCFACAHKCLIFDGKTGICKIRFNRDGILFVPFNYVVSLQPDPIEKKPFFHVLPGSKAFSFGMFGCDFHCSFCQNWITTQVLRDPLAGAPIQKITAKEIVDLAIKYKSQIIASTYNEPLITSEWALEIFKIAKKNGIRTAYVSNGNATEEVLDCLKPHLDFFKVDLKTFSDSNYRTLGGTLNAVLNTIRLLVKKGFWVEVVTLIVPKLNDSDEELKKIAEFLSSVSSDIPWHVTAFHPDYKMEDRNSTKSETLLKAVDIGKKSGLKFIYAGNLPGSVENHENTYCYSCRNLLIERFSFRIIQNLIKNNSCPNCNARIPGVWK